MADLTITAANCVPVSGSTLVQGTAGETIAAGKAVYKASATGKWMLADSNAAGAEARGADGLAIAVNGASLNQPVTVLTHGQVTLGATLTAGVAYYLSDTPGGICPVADIGAGEYVHLIGIATTAAILDVDPKYSAVSL